MIEDVLNHVKLSLDVQQCPETIEYLESIKSFEGISSYELASEIISCDRDKAMPQELFAFLVTLYKQAISAGNVDAMNDLGALYYDGRGCCQDFTKAVYYYEMAAAHGSEIARESLGYCYYYGRDIPVDYEKAFNCFAEGAFLGRLNSLYKIGDMYRNGYYVEKNLGLALKIYLRCYQIMNPHEDYEVAGQIFLRLGNAFLYGEGTEKDPREALRYFHFAEAYLYDLVASGEEMYSKSLKAAIDGQAKARKILAKKLPSLRWPQE